MFKKKYIIVYTMAFITVVIGICMCNISLNRTIYCNEVHMKASEEYIRNSKNEFDLDDMEKKLDLMEDKMNNPKKYAQNDSDILFKVNVPKYRVLFNLNPFDLRFEDKNYKLYMNNTILRNLNNDISNIFNKLNNIINFIREKFNI